MRRGKQEHGRDGKQNEVDRVAGNVGLLQVSRQQLRARVQEVERGVHGDERPQVARSEVHRCHEQAEQSGLHGFARRLRNRDAQTDSAFTTMVLNIEQRKLDSQAWKAQVILSREGKKITYSAYRRETE